MEIYLDYAATTPLDDDVIASMHESMKKNFGNPSSLHRKGLESEKLIKQAKRTILDSLASKNGDLIFTSGGTEANNLAITGSLRSAKRDQIITSGVEHASVLTTIHHMEDQGYTICELSVDKSGALNVDELISSLNEQTRLVSIMYINNENGYINDIMGITKLIKERYPQVIVHTDAVQAYGKIDIDVEKLGVDLMTISAHKIHGPKGVGALYIRKGLTLNPMIHGGMQQKGIRPGTENLHGIVGFEAAVKALTKNDSSKVLALRQQFIEGITERIDDVIINSSLDESTPYVMNLAFLDAKAEVLLHTLESKGVYVSSGSACHSSKDTASHVLKGMQLAPKVIDASIRVSFSRMTTEHQIEEAINKIEESVSFIRKMTRR